MRFAGKIVLVTGGGSGIGRAVARGFAREGARVVVSGRGRDRLDETVQLIGHDGGRGEAVAADVTRDGDVAALVGTITDRHGGLDVAVNNAGTFAMGPLAGMAEEEWRRVFDTNVHGVFLCMKHEIAAMRARGGGVIVNVGSTIGPHLRLPGMSAYGASKAAISTLTRTAALECIRDGIRINAVSPGPHDTPMSMRPGETEADRADRMRGQLPIGRVGTLDEITGTVLWLASADAGFAVGHDLVIDGGAAA